MIKWLGFYPDAVAARVQAVGVPPRVLTLGQSLGIGAGGFCLISAVVSAIAELTQGPLKKHLGEGGTYGLYAVLLVLMAGGLFRRLVIPPAPTVRFYILFTLALSLYGAGWTAAYLPFPNTLGEWLGSWAGATGIGLAFAAAFDAPKQVAKVILILFVTNSAGYFSAVFLRHAIPGAVGGLLWGVARGLGLGTGLSYALYACQGPARHRLKALSKADTIGSSSAPRRS